VLGKPSERDVGVGQHRVTGQLVHPVGGERLVDLGGTVGAVVDVRRHHQPALRGQPVG
jgi:hypothetical protein